MHHTPVPATTLWAYLRPWAFVCLVALLTGCFPEEDMSPPSYDVPTVAPVSGASGGLHPAGGIVSIPVAVTANAFLERLEIRAGGTLLTTITFDVSQGSRQQLSYVYTVPLSSGVGSTIGVTFTLFDRQGAASSPYTYTVTVGDPIVPSTFTQRDTLVGGQPFRYITGQSNQFETLVATNRYLINDTLRVTDGGILAIPAGTQLYFTQTATTTGSLRIGIASRLNAEGTSTQPVVFTSLSQAPGQVSDTLGGDWGGIEIDGLGGTDNSGILRYVRIEYSGAIDAASDPLDPSRINGLRLNNVGSATEVDFLQLYRCNGDALQVDGGAVNLRHVFGFNSGESSVRWANGWLGFAQFILCYSTVGKDGERELRSDESSSKPTMSNITLLGPGTIGPVPNSNRGIRLQNAARGRFHNMLVTEYRNSQGIRTDGAIITDENGDLAFLYTHSWNNSNNWHSSTGTLRSFTGNTNGDATVGTAAGIGLNDYVGVYLEGQQFDPTTLNPWFQPGNFAGAVPSDNDWTASGSWARNPDGTLR